jgi:prophage tail gpP-like protein
MDDLDKVELLIGGKMQGDWEDYEIDSDLLTPADGWHVSMGMSGGEIPPDVFIGAPVEVRVGGDCVLMGRVDEISHPVKKTSHTFSISGRDHAAALIDCSAPVFSARMASLKDIVAKIVSVTPMLRALVKKLISNRAMVHGMHWCTLPKLMACGLGLSQTVRW